MFKSTDEVLAYLKDNDVKFVDVRFCDLPGVMQHFNVPAASLDEDFFTDGQMFDGSSIRGFQTINESDMKLIPDPTTAYIDPFREMLTLNINMEIVDPFTGEVRMAEIFVAVLGASNLTYAEATWTQTLPDWIGAHVRMFRFYGSAPRLLVPDNLKSGVNKPSFYDPELNRTYAAMAAHYGVGVLPARPRKPRDKAAVEAGVRFAQGYILGRLRHVTFFSLAACNTEIDAAVARMNGREMRRLGVSRRQLFEAVELPVMQPLPEHDYEYAEWRLARVGIDYHVEVQGFFYSVPHALIREQVDTRATSRTIEVFHRGKRIAAHARRYGGQRHGTLPEHMPSAHRRYGEWTPERLRHQARTIGPNTEGLIIAVLVRRPHPEQGFRTCLGVLRLFRGINPARAEAVSLRAIEIGALTYASVASILKHRLDRLASPQAADDTPLLHDNFRGSRYYH